MYEDAGEDLGRGTKIVLSLKVTAAHVLIPEFLGFISDLKML